MWTVLWFCVTTASDEDLILMTRGFSVFQTFVPFAMMRWALGQKMSLLYGLETITSKAVLTCPPRQFYAFRSKCHLKMLRSWITHVFKCWGTSLCLRYVTNCLRYTLMLMNNRWIELATQTSIDPARTGNFTLWGISVVSRIKYGVNCV